MAKATFEENLVRLDEIVKKLEQGDAPLDDALKLFDEGSKLVTHLGGLLDKAEQKVKLIMKNSEGEPQESLFTE